VVRLNLFTAFHGSNFQKSAKDLFDGRQFFVAKDIAPDAVAVPVTQASESFALHQDVIVAAREELAAFFI